MARGVKHSDELRAQVIAELLAGKSEYSVAKAFGLSKSTVSAWRSAMDGAGVAEVGPETKATIEGMLVEYVRSTFATLEAIRVQIRDPHWLKAQTAGEIAGLYRIVDDANIRVLAACDGGGSD